MKKTILFLLFMISLSAKAQIGEHRNDLAIGVNGGYVLGNVGFTPTVPQKMHGGLTGGFTVRYTSEKYFKSICAIVGEVNIAQMGWKEDILNVNDEPVINSVTGVAEEYERQLTYIQVPLMARLGWGRERKGFQAFFQLGPQVGFFLSDKTTTNFEWEDRNIADRVGVQQYAYQDTMSVKNKFDYGIAVGAGLEFSRPKIGHFLLEARYYYGLGNIFGNSKADTFGKSNNGSMMVKVSYLFDIIRTRNQKIK